MKGTEPAFPDEANHQGIDILTYIATQMMAVRTSRNPGQGCRQENATMSVSDAKELIAAINRETEPKSQRGSIG